MDDAWTGNANIDYGLRFPGAVKCPRHEWVILDCVGKTDKFGAGNSTLIASAFSCVLNDSPDLAGRIHIDPRARRRNIDGRTQSLGGGQRGGNGIQKLNLATSGAFVDQSGVAANKIDSNVSGRLVYSAR